MQKNNLEVELHYSDEDFNELMKKLVYRKINESIKKIENKNPKNNQTTIHQVDTRR